MSTSSFYLVVYNFLFLLSLQPTRCAIPNCSFEISGQCLSCNVDYFPSQDYLSCQNSIVGCILYSSSTLPSLCLNCNSQMSYSLTQNSQHCLSVVTKCSLYSDSGSCISCEDEYYLLNSLKCAPCIEKNCKKCDTQGKCLQCINSAYTLSDSKCVCSDGFYSTLDYSSSTSICLPCQKGCSSCNSLNGVCESCKSNRSLLNNCECEDGYVEESGQCIQCQMGSYKHHSQCIANCPKGFYNNNSTRTCLQCQSKEEYQNIDVCSNLIKGKMQLISPRIVEITLLNGEIEISDQSRLLSTIYLEPIDNSTPAFSLARINSSCFQIIISKQNSMYEKTLHFERIISNTLTDITNNSLISYSVMIYPLSIVLPPLEEIFSENIFIIENIGWSIFCFAALTVIASLSFSSEKWLSIPVETLQLLFCFGYAQMYLPYHLKVILFSLDSSNFRILNYVLTDSIPFFPSQISPRLLSRVLPDHQFLLVGLNYLIITFIGVILYYILTRKCSKSCSVSSVQNVPLLKKPNSINTMKQNDKQNQIVFSEGRDEENSDTNLQNHFQSKDKNKKTHFPENIQKRNSDQTEIQSLLQVNQITNIKQEKVSKELSLLLNKEEKEINLTKKPQQIILTKVDMIMRMARVPLLFSAASQLKKYNLNTHETDDQLSNILALFSLFIVLIHMSILKKKLNDEQALQRKREQKLNKWNYSNLQEYGYILSALLAGWSLNDSQIQFEIEFIVFAALLLVKLNSITFQSRILYWMEIASLTTLLIFSAGLFGLSLIQAKMNLIQSSLSSSSHSNSLNDMLFNFSKGIGIFLTSIVLLYLVCIFIFIILSRRIGTNPETKDIDQLSSNKDSSKKVEEEADDEEEKLNQSNEEEITPPLKQQNRKKQKTKVLSNEITLSCSSQAMIPKSMPLIEESTCKGDETQEKNSIQTSVFLNQMEKYARNSKNKQVFVAPRKSLQLLKSGDSSNHNSNKNNQSSLDKQALSSIQVIEFEELKKLVNENQSIQQKLNSLEKKQKTIIDKLANNNNNNSIFQEDKSSEGNNKSIESQDKHTEEHDIDDEDQNNSDHHQEQSYNEEQNSQSIDTDSQQESKKRINTVETQKDKKSFQNINLDYEGSMQQIQEEEDESLYLQKQKIQRRKRKILSNYQPSEPKMLIVKAQPSLKTIEWPHSKGYSTPSNIKILHDRKNIDQPFKRENKLEEKPRIFNYHSKSNSFSHQPDLITLNKCQIKKESFINDENRSPKSQYEDEGEEPDSYQNASNESVSFKLNSYHSNQNAKKNPRKRKL